MTIDQLIKRGSLEKRDSSAEELADLLQIVDRDIRDSKSSEVSYDWQFGIAYNVAQILGPDSKDDAIYLDACRRKRNLFEYESINGATQRRCRGTAPVYTRIL